MTDMTKDEVVKMAREAGAIISPQWGIASNVGTATFERFAALCRAPLVAEVERLKDDLEQTRVQLAGCGVAAMQNTEESKANRVERGAYGWPESYGDVCRMVDSEIELRAENARLKDDYQNACKTVAEMHAAAVGQIVGPNRGVVEDVTDLRTDRDDWKARALKSEQAGEPVAYIAWKNDKPCYEGDDAICEDAVWPVDSDDYRTSMPVFTAPQPAAQESVAHKEDYPASASVLGVEIAKAKEDERLYGVGFCVNGWHVPAALVSCWGISRKSAQQQPSAVAQDLTDEQLERQFCEIVGLESINPKAADTRRACLWFTKGYRYAAPPQPAAQEPVVEPVAWSHGCNALCTNIDLWISHCPHCGKPRPAAPVPQEPTSAVPVVWQMVEALERKLPGGKQTDDFESSRIGDYNQGWNDYRKAVKKMFKNINMNSSENSNPDAYLYSLEYGEKVVDTKVSIHQLNYPFGVAGADYLVRNDDGVSYVRQTKLYAALSRALAAGQKFIKENGK